MESLRSLVMSKKEVREYIPPLLLLPLVSMFIVLKARKNKEISLIRLAVESTVLTFLLILVILCCFLLFVSGGNIIIPRSVVSIIITAFLLSLGMVLCAVDILQKKQEKDKQKM